MSATTHPGRVWRRTRSLSRRLREVEPHQLGLLFHTFFLLLTARIALHLIPVSRIIAWKTRPLRHPDLRNTEQDHALVRAQTRWAVLVVARYSPVQFVCFPQCLAASALLRRHGISSRLHYGVTREDDKLITHTWLEAGGEIVIGGEVAPRFSTLATY
jgi:hypothetical protein